MSAKRRTISRKRITDQKGKKTYSNEQSPYWNAVRSNSSFRLNKEVEGDEYHELPEANPDSLPESSVMWPPRNEQQEEDFRTTKALMMQAIAQAKLSTKEREVLLHIQEGTPLLIIAKKMKLSRMAIRTLLERARKKIQKIFVAIRAQDGIISRED